ncbi:hypothetical protein E3T26_14350 [Cryobacterium sp. TMT1-21]|uniref:hypothetical protein n=1 Tax=Cryobacterium sp. TMT1-21 TaxID=1259234 RepID=UPI00106B43AC|nr:hypothetical protein [Cryobacterium sp. TMT1-21]TFD09805.1 hypothetical protein E3T26_14350 [Cryobacterium sp. TMT1-21]
MMHEEEHTDRVTRVAIEDAEAADRERRVPPAAEVALTTVECSMPGERYTLLDSGPHLALHLAGPGARGGTGPCICGFDRHARDANGRHLVGFSVGGGVTGPGVRHAVCAGCASLAGGRTIRGTNAALFAPATPGTNTEEAANAHS